MMGPNNLGDINDMLTLCEKLPEDITGNVIMDWTKSVAVTGFEGDNSTLSILEELKKEGVENRNLSFFEFDMSYKNVEEMLPPIRMLDYKDFVLHLAHHNIQNTISLEQCAFTTGYTQPDKNGYVPKVEDSEVLKIETKVNCDELKTKLTEKLGLDGVKFGGLKIEKSQDSGRPIDAYLYQLSLQQDAWSTLLVKIPPFEGTCTKEAVAEVIRELIKNVTSTF